MVPSPNVKRHRKWGALLFCVALVMLTVGAFKWIDYRGFDSLMLSLGGSAALLAVAILLEPHLLHLVKTESERVSRTSAQAVLNDETKEINERLDQVESSHNVKFLQSDARSLAIRSFAASDHDTVSLLTDLETVFNSSLGDGESAVLMLDDTGEALPGPLYLSESALTQYRNIRQQFMEIVKQYAARKDRAEYEPRLLEFNEPYVWRAICQIVRDGDFRS